MSFLLWFLKTPLPFWSWYLVQHQVNHSRITSLHIRHWTPVGYYCSHLSRIFDPSTNTTWKLCMCQRSRETIRQNHFFDCIMSIISVNDDLHRWEAEKWGLESTIQQNWMEESHYQDGFWIGLPEIHMTQEQGVTLEPSSIVVSEHTCAHPAFPPPPAPAHHNSNDCIWHQL